MFEARNLEEERELEGVGVNGDGRVYELNYGLSYMLLTVLYYIIDCLICY